MKSVLVMVAVSKWAINMLAPANEPCSRVDPFRLANANVEPVAATEVRMAEDRKSVV